MAYGMIVHPPESARMVVNQEILAIFAEHYAKPTPPDGICNCGEFHVDGQIAHLIEVLQSKRGGNMPTFTEEPDVQPDYFDQDDGRVSSLIGPAIETGEGNEGQLQPMDWDAAYMVKQLAEKALDTALALHQPGNPDDQYPYIIDVNDLLADATKIYNWLVE